MSDTNSRIAISLADWESLLEQCTASVGNSAAIIPQVEAAVHVKLRESGVDPTTVFSPIVIEMEHALAEAPPSIRDADFLTLEEKHGLYLLVKEGAGMDDVSENQLIEATRTTLALIQRDRSTEREGVRRRGAPSVEYVTSVFCEQLSEIRDDAIRRGHDEFFADDETLREGIITHLAEVESIQESSIGGRPAAEMLSDRLRGLDRAEFHLIASLVLSVDAVDDACRRWLLAMGGAVHEEADLAEGA